jgi:hypothetical protein
VRAGSPSARTTRLSFALPRKARAGQSRATLAGACRQHLGHGAGQEPRPRSETGRRSRRSLAPSLALSLHGGRTLDTARGLRLLLPCPAPAASRCQRWLRSLLRCSQATLLTQPTKRQACELRRRAAVRCAALAARAPRNPTSAPQPAARREGREGCSAKAAARAAAKAAAKAPAKAAAAKAAAAKAAPAKAPVKAPAKVVEQTAAAVAAGRRSLRPQLRAEPRPAAWECGSPSATRPPPPPRTSLSCTHGRGQTRAGRPEGRSTPHAQSGGPAAGLVASSVRRYATSPAALLNTLSFPRVCRRQGSSPPCARS